MNLKGEQLISCEYGDLNVASDRLYSAKLYPDGKYGYIDHDENVIIDYQYDWAGDFEDGYALVFKSIGRKFLSFYIDEFGNELYSPK
jgi:hypothetical protein